MKRRPGPGRGHRLVPYEPSVTFSVTMPQSMREKLRRLGGAAWIRWMVERADVEKDSVDRRIWDK